MLLYGCLAGIFSVLIQVDLTDKDDKVIYLVDGMVYG